MTRTSRRDYWRRLSVGRHVLFAIRPDPSASIFSGEKAWEYRTKPPAQDPPYLGIVYETEPTQAIVGLFRVREHKTGDADQVAYWTIDDVPTTKADLRDYADGQEVTAISAVDPLRIETPIAYSRIRATDLDWRPPQNFQYVGLKTHPELIGVIGSRLVIDGIRKEAGDEYAAENYKQEDAADYEWGDPL